MVGVRSFAHFCKSSLARVVGIRLGSVFSSAPLLVRSLAATSCMLACFRCRCLVKLEVVLAAVDSCFCPGQSLHFSQIFFFLFPLQVRSSGRISISQMMMFPFFLVYSPPSSFARLLLMPHAQITSSLWSRVHVTWRDVSEVKHIERDVWFMFSVLP